MRPALLAFTLCTAAIGQDLVAFGVDIGAPYIDFTQPDFNGDGKDDLLFQLPGTPPTYEVWYQTSDGKGFGDKRRWVAPEGTAGVAIVDAVPPAGDDFVYLASDGARVVPGDSSDGTSRPWVRAELVFPPGFSGEPRHWGYGKDLNGDDIEDLVLPGLDGALLVVGRPDGKRPGPPIAIPHPVTRTRFDRNAGSLRVRRARPRLQFASMLTGNPVPAWLGTGGLLVLPRAGQGFAATPLKLFALPSDKPTGLGLLRRIDVDLADLDSDGLDDLVLTRTEATGGGVPERRTDLLFFRNPGKPSRRPAQILLLPGVLSSGPYLEDVDGDGHVDLFLSLFAGDLKSEMQRRVFGRVTLDYHLYLGTGETPPFPRSPSLSLQDKLGTRTFESWGLRHRRDLSRDWNADGKRDLVSLAADKNSCTATIRYASGSGPDLAFIDGPEFRWEGAVVDYTVTAIEKGRPAIRLKTRTGVTFIVRP